MTAVFISAPYTFDIFRLSFRGLFLLINNKSYLFLIGFIALIAFLILFNSYKNKIVNKFCQRKKFIPYFQHIVAFFIFMFVIYAFFIRPTGLITSNSYNLVKLSWYMSGFYGILLATFGFVLLLHKKPYSETYFFLTIFLIYAMFYIMTARISLDHPWWIRRYLPVVIPSAILCIGYFMDWIKDLKIKETQTNKIIPIILLIILLVPSIMADSKMACHTEYSNAIEQIDDLSNIFEKNSVILYHRNYYAHKVATPLYYIHEKEIRPVTISEKSVDKIYEWIDSNKTVYLMDIIEYNDIIEYKNKEQFLKLYVNWTTLHGMKWKNHGYFFIPGDSRTEKHMFSILILKDLNDLNKIQTLNSNWHGLEHWHNIPTRWTSNNATISIYSPENRDSCLSFDVLSFYKPRTLQVCLNDDLIHEQKIPTSFVEIETAVKLKEGENILKFYTANGCQRPVDIPELKNEDGRCLSLAFQNIMLTPRKKNYDVNFIEYSISDLMMVNSFYLSNITIENTGSGKWDKNGKYPVYVSYHWLKDGKVVLWDGIRNKLPCDVTPDTTIEMNININAPHEEGNYTLIIDLVKEGITWFETQGAVPLKKNVGLKRRAQYH
jgi:hypothetical protein